MKAELIRRLLTFELTMMLSKYERAFIFSLTVTLFAIAEYTSLR